MTNIGECTELTCPHHGAEGRARQRALDEARTAELDEATRVSIELGTYTGPVTREFAVTVTAATTRPLSWEEIEELDRGLPAPGLAYNSDTGRLVLEFVVQAPNRTDATIEGSRLTGDLFERVLGERLHSMTTAKPAGEVQA